MKSTLRTLALSLLAVFALAVPAAAQTAPPFVPAAPDGTPLVFGQDAQIGSAAKTNGPQTMCYPTDVAPTTASVGAVQYLTCTPDGRVWFTPAASAYPVTGATAVGVASAGTTNSTNVKASGGNLYSITLVNTTATKYYIRFYNLASAPTCSSATGYLFTIPIPASTDGAGVAAPLPAMGIAFSTGISYCLTGGPTSTDNTNAATGIYGVLGWK